MEESKNNKVQISKYLVLLFNYRFKRELGALEPLNIELIKNRRQSYTFKNFFTSNEFPIEEFPSLGELKSSFIDSLSKKQMEFPVTDFEQLLYSILKTFNYSTKSNIVNQRLSFFCLNNILNCSKFTFIPDRNGCLKKLFNHFLYFSQNSETFIKSLWLDSKGINYHSNKIDLLNYILNYFEFISKNKDKLEYGNKFMNEDFLVLKEICIGLIRNIFKIEKLELDKANPFDITQFFELYNSDKKNFYKELENQITYYVLDSWENSDNRTSCYYGKKIISEIENSKPAKRKRYNKRKKIYAEHFIDSYLFYMVSDKNEIEELQKFVDISSYIYLRFIIKTHPLMKRDVTRMKKIRTLSY